MKKQIKLLQAYLPVLAALALVSVFLALAQSYSAAAETTNQSNTLQVSPVRSDIEVDPGESHTVAVTVTNLTEESITINPVQNDFVAGDESGTPALILDEDEFAPNHSLKRFMQPIDNVTIPADDAVTVDVVIDVPESAQAGGYFGAVRFQPANLDGDGQVNLNSSVASLILMTVPGDIDENLNLTNFDIRQDGTSGSFFMNTDNLLTSIRFQNPSDVQLGPFGKISVQKGDEVVYEADFNNSNPREVILPDSARAWEVPLSDIEGFGQYEVSATFTYGQDNQTIEVNKSFWLIPLWLMITAGVVLLALVATILLIVRGKKQRKLRGSSRAKLK